MNELNLIDNKMFNNIKHSYIFMAKKTATEVFKDSFAAENLGGTIGGIASVASGAIGAGMQAAQIDTSKADNAVEAANNYQVDGASLDEISNMYNTAFARTDWSKEDFTQGAGAQLMNMVNAGLSGASSGASMGPWGAVAGAAAGLLSAGAGWLAGDIKAQKKAKELNRLSYNANIGIYNKTKNAINNAITQEENEFMRNLVAYGGPLYNHSGDWSNGLTFINEGGTHEENPFDGVLMGFDQENIPNLVEEGEIIYNDYVFSNRLKPSKKQLESSGLNKKYNDWTFAKIVEDLQKASAETPLDKISKESLDDMMATMINMQEEVRMKKGLKGQNRLMANGGNLFADGGPAGIDPYLTKVDISDIINAASEKLNFYNEPFVADELVELVDIAPTRAMMGKETTVAMPKLSSGALSLQPSLSNIGGLSPLGNKALQAKPTSAFDKEIKRSIQNNINNSTKSNFDWSSLGMYAPIIDSLGKTIYNIAKPVDESNIIAEDAYKELPVMELPRLTHHKVPYKPIDRNALINPVINTGRATASDIQNIGTTGADVMNRLALNAYNTQKAIGQAYLEADRQDLANRMQNAQFNLGVDSADAGLLQATQTANMQRAEKIAAARIADATQREQLEQLKGQAIDTTSAATMQGIADLTRQNIEWNWIKNNPQYAEAVAAIQGKKANGGMLTRKKRRK